MRRIAFLIMALMLLGTLAPSASWSLPSHSEYDVPNPEQQSGDDDEPLIRSDAPLSTHPAPQVQAPERVQVRVSDPIQERISWIQRIRRILHLAIKFQSQAGIP